MLELPADLEQQLREEAAHSGQEVGQYILWLMERYESRKGQAAEETRAAGAQSINEEPIL